MQCVVLAGGLGSRLEPLTHDLPKHLAPVGEHPFAHYQLSWMREHGVTEVVYCIGRLGGMIRDYVGDGSRWGLGVRWVDEGEELLGTAGAVRLALDRGALAPHFLVLYGDSYLRLDVAAMWRAYRRCAEPAMMAVLRNEGRWDTSNVRFADGRVLLYDKAAGGDGMRYIDYGLSALDRRLVSELVPPGRRHDLAAVYHELSLGGRLAGYEVGERFFEIGSPQSLDELRRWILARRSDAAR